MEYKNKNILVYGFGKSGESASKLLKKLEATVFVTMDGNMSALQKQEIASGGFVFLEMSEAEKMLKNKCFDGVVLSPSISINSEFSKLAKRLKIEITGELELASENYDGEIVAITGTNGKTTTTTLVDKILLHAGFDSHALGNIGKPLSDDALMGNKNAVAVVEASSFQLESVKNFKPKIAAILNVATDHLDRHKDMNEYINAKFNIFKNQTESDFLVLNSDDEITLLAKDIAKSKVIYFSRNSQTNGAYVAGDSILFGEKGEYVMPISAIKIPGAHNEQNVLAAVTICKLMRAPNEKISSAISSFNGISHRLELVRTLDKVKYYNDSKGTNIGSTIVAIDAMKGKSVLILGGSDKGYEYDELFDKFNGRISAVIAFGATAHKICEAASRCNFENVFRADSLKEVVLLARYLAKENENVLFSPASASFDMFQNYAERGNKFTSLVNLLV